MSARETNVNVSADEPRGPHPTHVLYGRRVRTSYRQPRPAPAHLLVVAGRIREVAWSDTCPPPWRRHPRAHLGDLYVGPGLIDAHVHVTAPGDGSPDGVPSGDLSQAAARALDGLRSVGVTTARDCGGPTPFIHTARSAAGPRLLTAGPPLTTPGGHGGWMGGEAADTGALLRLVDEQVLAGAAFVKVMGSGGGTAGTHPWDASFTADQLCAVVDRATGHGRPVAVHCLSAASMRAALRARPRTIEHGKFRHAPGDTVEPREKTRIAEGLRATGTAVTSTLSVGHFVIARGPAAGDAYDLWLRRQDGDLDDTAMFLGAGVTVIPGTDAGWRHTPFTALPRELTLLTQCGMSPADALVAATETAAAALALPGLTGTLDPGALADYVAYPSDPLRDFTVLDRPAVVVVGGRWPGDDPAAGTGP